MENTNAIAVTTDEALAANNKNASEVKGDTKDKSPKRDSLVSSIIDTISSSVGDMAKVADAKAVSVSMRRILTTLFLMASLDEYAIGPKVKGEQYRYGDYSVPKLFASLMPAKRVIVRDTITAINYLDSESYSRSLTVGDVLSPSDFSLEWRKLCMKLRINPDVTTLSRPSIELLSEATKYAVNGRKVPDVKADRFVFLKQQFDYDACMSIIDWCHEFAMKVVEQ